jgi:uncharacterized membrane protein YtjA (UPF0391 family)
MTGGGPAALAGPRAPFTWGGCSMIRWALAFLVLAVIAALFGFSGLAATSAGIAKTLFIVFLVAFVATLVISLITGRRAI